MRDPRRHELLEEEAAEARVKHCPEKALGDNRRDVGIEVQGGEGGLREAEAEPKWEQNVESRGAPSRGKQSTFLRRITPGLLPHADRNPH